MYHVKMAFALIQVGSHLWINPMQVEGVQIPGVATPGCETLIAGPAGVLCSDWPFDKIKEALSAAAVAKAMEGK
jgi:hypothetical protein